MCDDRHQVKGDGRCMYIREMGDVTQATGDEWRATGDPGRVMNNATGDARCLALPPVSAHLSFATRFWAFVGRHPLFAIGTQL